MAGYNDCHQCEEEESSDSSSSYYSESEESSDSSSSYYSESEESYISSSSYYSESEESYDSSSSYYSESKESYYSESKESYYSDYTTPTAAETAMITSRLPSFIKPTKIIKTKNYNIWQRYQANKANYQYQHGNKLRELSLWHATSVKNADSILEQNFNWRYSVRGLYGSGVCFSNDAGYANFHCNHSNGDDRALILTNVLVGATCSGYPDMENPKQGCDTAVSKYGSVYVKFADDEFYPAYVVNYNNRLYRVNTMPYNDGFYKANTTLHGAVAVNMGPGN